MNTTILTECNVEYIKKQNETVVFCIDYVPEDISNLDVGDYFYASNRKTFEILSNRYSSRYVKLAPNPCVLNCETFNSLEIFVVYDTSSMYKCIAESKMFVLLTTPYIMSFIESSLPDTLVKVCVFSHNKIGKISEWIYENNEAIKKSIKEYRNTLILLAEIYLEDLYSFKETRISPPVFISTRDLENITLNAVNTASNNTVSIKKKIMAGHSKVARTESLVQELMYCIKKDPSEIDDCKITFGKDLLNSIKNFIKWYFETHSKIGLNVVNFSYFQNEFMNLRDSETEILDTDLHSTFVKFEDFYKSKGVIPYTRTWIGVVASCKSLDFVHSPIFKKSIQFCKRIIVACLSHKIKLREIVDGSVEILLVRRDNPPVKFEWKQFEDNMKKILFISGSDISNIVVPDNCQLVLEEYTKQRDCELYKNLVYVHDPDNEFVISKCAIANTPIFVPRSIISESILGENYPLYCNTRYELVKKLEWGNEFLVYSAYIHLLEVVGGPFIEKV